MKTWNDYGSEHSANLVMIGSFKEVDRAEDAKKIIERICEQVAADIQADEMEIIGQTERYTDGMRSVLEGVGLHTLAPIELEQFGYDVQVDLQGKDIVIRTDEADISAFLKVMVENGARVEVFSGHDYPEEKGK